MQSSNQKRVAIVTGAGSGLGKSHALYLAAEGFHVVVNDIAQSAEGTSTAKQTVSEIEALGGSAVANLDNISDWDGAHALAETALEHFGRIDAVVNNAGVLRDKTFIKMTRDDIDLVLAVNLMGSIYVTKACWPHLINQKYGRIVLTSSASGLVDAYGQANYGAAKAGVVGLMNTLKNEGRKHGVFVNSICPLATTQMTEGLLGAEIANMSKPGHVSSLVAWLSSEACEINGSIFAVGAGHYAEVRLLKSHGIVLDPLHPAMPAQIGDDMERIRNFDNPINYTGVLDPGTKKALGLE